MRTFYYDPKDKIILKSMTWHFDNRPDGKVYLANKTHKKIYFHRLIMGAKKGQMVDHINGNTLDNRRKNLRIVTNKQNNYNRRSNKEFKGVFFKEALGKYVAQIMFNRKTIYLGVFVCDKKAAKAYNKKAKELFGKYAWLNKI